MTCNQFDGRGDLLAFREEPTSDQSTRRRRCILDSTDIIKKNVCAICATGSGSSEQINLAKILELTLIQKRIGNKCFVSLKILEKREAHASVREYIEKSEVKRSESKKTKQTNNQ